MSYVGLDPNKVRRLAQGCRDGASGGDDIADRQRMWCNFADLTPRASSELRAISDDLSALATALDARAALAESLQFDPGMYGGWGLVARLNRQLDSDIDGLWRTLTNETGKPPDDLALAASVLIAGWELDSDGPPDVIDTRVLTEVIGSSDDPAMAWAAGMILLDPMLTNSLTSLAKGRQYDGSEVAFSPVELALLAESGAKMVKTDARDLPPPEPPLLSRLWSSIKPEYDWGSWDRTVDNLWLRARSLPLVAWLTPGHAPAMLASYYGSLGVGSGPLSVSYSGAGGENRLCFTHPAIFSEPSIEGLLGIFNPIVWQAPTLSFTPKSTPPSSGYSFDASATSSWFVGGGVSVGEDGHVYPSMNIGLPSASAGLNYSHCTPDLPLGPLEDPVDDQYRKRVGS